LNGASGAGLADVILQPDSTLEAMVTRLPAINLDVLPAGRPTDQPYELLRTPRMAALLEDARRQYDFVVIDTSPFLLVSDARSLERLVDGFLVVVGAHRTPRKLVDDVLRLISRRKLIGLVFNGGDRPLSGYYGYYDESGTAASRDDALADRGRR
jgi:Mrp family chromosome partitioning ATPase